MTKNAGGWSGLLVAGYISILGCDQLERKPRPQAVEPAPVVIENNWQSVNDLPEGTIAQLALGYDHSCVRFEDGKVACWGSNAYGEIGAPLATKYSIKPVLIESPKFSQIVAGDHVTCGLEIDTTEMYCWGDNSHGQLGLGEAADKSEKPVKILRTVDSALQKITNIYADYSAVCAMIEKEGPLCWGSTIYVRSEKKEMKDVRVIDHLSRVKTPTPLNTGPTTPEYGPAWTGSDTSELVILKNDVCAINGSRRNIRCLDAKLDIAEVSNLAGKNTKLFYSLVPKAEGYEVYQLDPAKGKIDTITDLPGLNTTVAAGEKHACANFGESGAYCWTTGEGGNEYGQLGFNGGAESMAPYALPNEKIKFLSSGSRHSCAVKEDNTTSCWGGSDQGQTGVEPRWRPLEKKNATPAVKPAAAPLGEVETV